MRRQRTLLVAVVSALDVASSLAACGGSDDDGTPQGAEPTAGSWKTWVLSAPEQIRVPPPPGSDSATAKRDASALEAARRARTPQQAALAREYGGLVVDRAKRDGAEA